MASGPSMDLSSFTDIMTCILGVLVFRLLTDVARPELERLGVIKPSMSEAVAR